MGKENIIYENPAVTVDLIVFTIEEEKLKVLMVKRSQEPFINQLALPGVFVGISETLEEAAKRGLSEETRLEDIYLEQLYTWGAIHRDPRSRIISVSYMALVPKDKVCPQVGKRVSEVGLFPVEELLEHKDEIAFDHGEMIAYAVERIRNKVEYTSIAFEMVGEEFTLPQLQKVYEIILGKPLYKANFRKKIIHQVEETGAMTEGESHRPSKIYRKKRENKGEKS